MTYRSGHLAACARVHGWRVAVVVAVVADVACTVAIDDDRHYARRRRRRRLSAADIFICERTRVERNSPLDVQQLSIVNLTAAAVAAAVADV